MPPLLTILVPVYREERTLPTIMSAIAAACPATHIIYIDDGSDDKSLEILRTYARPQDTVIATVHGGKGSAIRQGLAKATGTYTVIQDADLEYDPKEISLLLQKAQQKPGTAVFGSRFLQPNPNIYKRFLWGNKVMTFCLNLLFNSRITDSYTCYKLLPTDAFQRLDLQSNGFELEAEICATCIKAGIPVEEVPISYHPRTLEEGKKIGFKDAIKGMLMMVKVRLRKS